MTENKRGAGVLLHISSLPSRFGIGDLGPEAKKIANFLHHSGQKYWQFLPLNPTEQGQAHSPYSSISSRAGNTLFISPEWLANEGLLDHEELHQFHLPLENKINFTEAEQVKTEIFEKAWENFQHKKGHQLQHGYKEFCRKEAYWLDDFSLYMLLKKLHENKPWFEWLEEYKMREKRGLKKLLSDNEEQIRQIQWLQF